MSKFIIKNILKQYLVFLTITALFRLLFFAFYFEKSIDAGFIEIINAFIYGFLLDNSSVNYLLIVPFFLYFFYSIFPVKVFLTINKYYTNFIIILLVMIDLSDIAIYNEWGTKLNSKAFSYLTKLDEAYHSARISVLIAGLISLIVLSYILIKLSNKFLWKYKPQTERSNIFSILFFIITPLLIFGSMRGSLQQIPISQSQSYHSKINFVNQASVNTPWNFFHSILANKTYMASNPYTKYTIEESRKEVDKLYDYKEERGVDILTTKTPNIVFVFLESWSADFIDELGSELHVTPNFSKMASTGVLFTEHYASGTLSHQGISSTFSAFPSTPFTYIIELPSKYNNLECFPKDLQKKGYNTSFHFGGQLNYGNIKAYIYFNEFDEIIEGKDFNSSIPSGRLGHHDQYLWDRVLTDIDDYPEPFFAVAFTGSTHSPYDMPVGNFKTYDSRYNKLLNSMYYADSCIADFMTKAETKAWYDSTLFVFVADHSHPSPFSHPFYSKEVRKIPLMFYGNVIKEEYRGMEIDKIMSQTDIAATLLTLLDMPVEKYHWSKDVFNPNTPNFAYFGFNNGYGVVTPKGNYTEVMGFEEIMEYNFETPQDSIEIRKLGKSFVKVLFQEYLDY
ncbi:MAG: sulfatase-like hydrolase/transferase [Bacteroidales bacterium]|nr:sulfatase-like hydrolase/transferase [Bacteroidales bacterium]